MPSRIAVLVLVCACGHPILATIHGGSSAWLAYVGGARDAEAYSRAVAIAPSGDVALVWEARGKLATASEPELVLSKYRADGRLVWTHVVRSPSCKISSWAAAVAVAPSGAVIVAASERPREPLCVLSYDASGRLAWSRQLTDTRDIPELGVDSHGQIAVVGGHGYNATRRAVTALTPAGAIAWQRDLEVVPERLVVTRSGAIGVLGYAVDDHGMLVDLDHATAEIDPVELVMLSSQGLPLTNLPISTGSAGEPPSLALALDGDAIYVGWNSREVGGAGFTGHLKKFVDRTQEWSHEERGSTIAALAADGGTLALLGHQRGEPVLRVLRDDGSERGRYALSSATVKSEVQLPGLSIDELAITGHVLALAGYIEKQARVDAAGELTTSCWEVTQSDHGDPPGLLHYEECASAAWLARFSLR